MRANFLLSLTLSLSIAAAASINPGGSKTLLADDTSSGLTDGTIVKDSDLDLSCYQTCVGDLNAANASEVSEVNKCAANGKTECVFSTISFLFVVDECPACLV